MRAAASGKSWVSTGTFHPSARKLPITCRVLCIFCAGKSIVLTSVASGKQESLVKVRRDDRLSRFFLA